MKFEIINKYGSMKSKEFNSLEELRDWALSFSEKDNAKDQSRKPEIIIDFTDMEIVIYDDWIE